MRRCPFRTARTFAAQGTRICASYGFSTPADRTECCTPLTRTAILLLGGDKTGNNRWYEENVPRADALYDEHLATLEKEKLQDG